MEKKVKKFNHLKFFLIWTPILLLGGWLYSEYTVQGKNFVFWKVIFVLPILYVLALIVHGIINLVSKYFSLILYYFIAIPLIWFVNSDHPNALGVAILTAVILNIAALIPLMIMAIFENVTDEFSRKARIKKKNIDEKKKQLEKDRQRINQENQRRDAIQNSESEKSTGTGFFINDLGYAITNNHVVGSSTTLKMAIKGKTYTGKVIATDRENDLAILKADNLNQDYFNLTEKDAERMDDITAVGYGFGKGISDEVKTTKGVVSALAGLNNNYSHLQIDASLQPGNSGGPVINYNGDVVGAAVSKMDAETVFNYTGSLPEGISFAIKSSTIKQFLDSNKIKYYSDSLKPKTKEKINELIDNAVLYIFS